MKVAIKVEQNCEKLWCELHTNEKTERVEQICDEISLIDENERDFYFSAWQNNKVFRLRASEIFRFYSERKKVFAQTEKQKFVIKMYLHEIETTLDAHDFKKFIRVSNTDIVNFDKAENLDLSIVGSIRVNMQNGESAFVSRRNVAKIKERLGI